MIVGVIQARPGSRRFPNKVLGSLAGHPMLWHVIRRLRRTESLDRIVVVVPPADADVLRPVLEAALWLFNRRNTLNLRTGFIPASRNRLVEQIKQDASGLGTPKYSVNELIGSFNQKKWAFQIVTAVLLIFILVYGIFRRT